MALVRSHMRDGECYQNINPAIINNVVVFLTSFA